MEYTTLKIVNMHATANYLYYDIDNFIMIMILL